VHLTAAPSAAGNAKRYPSCRRLLISYVFRNVSEYDPSVRNAHCVSIKGVLALDVFPEEMTAPLINRYLEIKARHLL
jgi:hypothetical protein